MTVSGQARLIGAVVDFSTMMPEQLLATGWRSNEVNGAGVHGLRVADGILHHCRASFDPKRSRSLGCARRMSPTMNIAASPDHPYSALAVLLVFVGLPVWVSSEASRRGRRGWAYGVATLLVAPLGLAAIGVCALRNPERRGSRSAAGVMSGAMLAVAAGLAVAGTILHS